MALKLCSKTFLKECLKCPPAVPSVLADCHPNSLEGSNECNDCVEKNDHETLRKKSNLHLVWFLQFSSDRNSSDFHMMFRITDL